MSESQKKSVLIIGGGAVGAIAALNLEVGGLANVTLVLRSNYAAVSANGFDIKSCDHGRVQGWKPSVGEDYPELHLDIHLSPTSPQHYSQYPRRKPASI